MKSLLSCLHHAQEHHYALGHFNISTIDNLHAIVSAARQLDVPVVIGVSEGERDFLGVEVVAHIVHSLRHQLDHPIFLNADHTFSLDRIKQVVQAGYDSVIFDGAQLSYQDNLAQTRQVVQYVKSKNPEILVEAEVGYIGTSSALLDTLPKDAIIGDQAMPTPEQITHFVSETQVDLISPAVGNIHGMLKNAPNPNLNVPLIEKIHQSVTVPLVLHGGLGITKKNFKEAINAGISLIHVNTELRVAWRHTLQRALTDEPDQVSPYKLLTPAQVAVHHVVLEKLKIFHQLSS